MKILYVTTISDTMGFFSEHIKMLQNDGHSVELAANFEGFVSDKVMELKCVQHHIPFLRSVCSKDNVRAYYEIKRLLQCGGYDIVHTHTPNASVLVRLACRKLRGKKGIKVFYTAHGFHFYKGAPFKNWLLFFPVEWICAHWTDVLITINKEDYRRAKRWMRAGKVEYVPGVGIDIRRFQEIGSDREEMRRSLGVGIDDVVILSIGELNRNKNHETVLRALARMKNPSLHYMIVGQGKLLDYLQKLAVKLGIADRVHLLEYREDVVSLYQCSDIYVLPSIREGLNVSLMEAMASGLPCIVSKIRGNKDLIIDGKGGFLCLNNRAEDYITAIRRLCNEADLRKKMGRFNREQVKIFGSNCVLEQMGRIYRKESGR